MVHKHIHKAFKRAFIPHEENNYHPHFFREHVILSIISILLFASLFSVTSYLVLRKTTYGTLVVASMLIDLTNDERIKNGLPPLSQNEKLTLSSSKKTEEMASYGYFSHTSPEGSAPWKFFQQAGYRYSVAGENLALNFPTSYKVHYGWLTSPEHKKNILDPRFSEIGISVLTSTYTMVPVLYIAQHFGSPASLKESTWSGSYSTPLGKLLFGGSRYTSYVYYIMMALTLLALVSIILNEKRRHHVNHIIIGILLLILTLLLTSINTFLIM